MKVDEIYHQNKESQVGVILQRTYFETEIDIFPNLNPFERSESATVERIMMSGLTSEQTEQQVCKIVRHQSEVPDDEFQPIPLKRIDSGPHQHHIQAPEETSETTEKLRGKVEADTAHGSTHRVLMDEIDGDPSEGVKSKSKVGEEKGKSGKKENTLTRMLRGIRADKQGQSNNDESTDRLAPNLSISKIFQRIKPVGQASRENFTKVMHRIGDALHKKPVAEERSKAKDLEQSKSQEGKLVEHRKIGEKQFKCRSFNEEANKTVK